MIREIMRDTAFLAQKAEPVTPADLPVAEDLLETLTAHKDGCVGMAANMIGVNKRIIAFDNEGSNMVMFNPVIVKRSEPYEAEEGCLSLTGTRKAKRWKSIRWSSSFPKPSATSATRSQRWPPSTKRPPKKRSS